MDAHGMPHVPGIRIQISHSRKALELHRHKNLAATQAQYGLPCVRPPLGATPRLCHAASLQHCGAPCATVGVALVVVAGARLVLVLAAGLGGGSEPP